MSKIIFFLSSLSIYHLSYVIQFFLAAFGACTARGALTRSRLLAAADPLISWEGRVLLLPDGSVSFDWPGVRAHVTLSRASWLNATILSPAPVSGLFRVTVDGVNSSNSFFTAHGSHTYRLAVGLNASAVHSVDLISALEPALLHPQPFLPAPPYTALAVVSFSTDGNMEGGGASLKRRVAVCGDSITAGFGAGGSPPDCPNPAVYSEDNTRTWGRLLCARFDAACDIIAWSGKGLYVNSPTAGTNETIPYYYRQTFGAGQLPYAPTWKFDTFTPDAVIINLGTNDFSHGHDTGPSFEANFTAAYVDFMRNLTVWHAAPRLPIFAASGPLTARPTAAIKAAVAAFTAEGGRAYFLDLQTGLGADGCYGHPSPRGHQAMADLAVPQIIAALGWQ